MSNADRQKRYRDKKRNAPVTQIMGIPVTRVTSEVERYASRVTPAGTRSPLSEVLDPMIDRCKELLSVEVGQEQPGQIQPVPVGDGVCITVGLDDYLSRPEAYATRAHPELLNWGEWMNSTDLEQAGLKANRVTIPGDWDYEGVVQAAGACL